MRKALLIGTVVTVLLALGGSIALFWAYQASRHVPEFYREAVALDPEQQEEARDEFVAETTALASDLHGSGRWQHLFTAEQINAWLALELPAHYPDMLAAELHDPRIELSPHEATIACRYDNGQLSTVLSLSVDVYLQEPNVLAVQIRSARAGALPVPLAQVLDAISHAARQLKLRLEWRKSQGDPVALITFPQPRDSQSQGVRLETVELRDGELFVAGTMARGPAGKLAESDQEAEEPADATADAPTKDQPLVGSATKATRQE